MTFQMKDQRKIYFENNNLKLMQIIELDENILIFLYESGFDKCNCRNLFNIILDYALLIIKITFFSHYQHLSKKLD